MSCSGPITIHAISVSYLRLLSGHHTEGQYSLHGTDVLPRHRTTSLKQQTDRKISWELHVNFKCSTMAKNSVSHTFGLDYNIYHIYHVYHFRMCDQKHIYHVCVSFVSLDYFDYAETTEINWPASGLFSGQLMLSWVNKGRHKKEKVFVNVLKRATEFALHQSEGKASYHAL